MNGKRLINALRRQQGFTLVELLIAMALGGALIVGILAVWQSSQQAYLWGAEAAEVQQNLRVAMDQMVRTIQHAGLNPTNQIWGGATQNDPAFVAFRGAGTSCLRLYADLDGNNVVSGANENVVFNLSGTDLMRQEGGGPDAGQPWVGPAGVAEPVALKIVANPGGVPIFQYFSGPNAVPPNSALAAGGAACASMGNANRTQIGRVVITLTVQGTVLGQTFTKTLISEARARNVP